MEYENDEGRHRVYRRMTSERQATWLLRSQAGAAPGWIASSLNCLLLWVLDVLLLQMIEQLVQRCLQCLCRLSAIKLPFQTFCL